jgi:tight adherence protein C
MSLANLTLGGHGAWLFGLVVGAVNFLTILSVMRALAPRDLVATRARAHAKRRSQLRAARISPRRLATDRPISLARRLLKGLKLDTGGEAVKAGDQLAQAGWRTRDAVTVFLTLRLSAPVIAGFLAYLAAPQILHGAAGFPRMMVSAAGVLAGAYLPTLLLRNAVARRRAEIRKGLPDALDLFVICAEAGLSLDSAIARVAREIGPTSAALADELGLTSIELGFLPNRREALTNLAKRSGSPDVGALVSTLVQTEKYGTPLAQALRVLATEFRDTRMMRAEEKAARLPATLTVPMITFVLPPLFVVLIGPAILQALSINWR